VVKGAYTHILKAYSYLTFDENKHIYYWKGLRVPLSVTGLVKQHVPKFDADKILPYSAMKASREEGRTVSTHELRRRWQLINENACNLGTRVHKFMENYTGIETPSLPQEEAGIKYIRDLEGKYSISFRELRAYSREFNYAGTMDLPLEVIGSNGYVVDDYKTTGDLFKAYDNLYPPFEYLESSAYNHYQLQLSYYQIMLEEVGLRIENRRLIHLKADGEYRIYDLQDYTKELKDYMKRNII